MSTLSFLETADVALAPDAVMAQLTGGAAASLGGHWQRLPDDRGVVVRTVRRSPKDSSRTTTVATRVTLEPVPGGTRLRMEVQMEFTGVLGWGIRMARPFARPRVRAAFRALLVALTTGDSRELHEQTVRTGRAALRVRAATLCIQLVFAGLLTAFVALVSWVDAVVVAAVFMVAAVFPIRRLLRARRALMAAASAVGHVMDRE